MYATALKLNYAAMDYAKVIQNGTEAKKLGPTRRNRPRRPRPVVLQYDGLQECSGSREGSGPRCNGTAKSDVLRLMLNAQSQD